FTLATLSHKGRGNNLRYPMLIDFQHHYTPSELLKGEPGKLTADLDRDGNPHYLLNPLLADLGAHIRMMDASGIDAGVLTCGSGFDQPDLAICRLINDRLRDAEKAHPGRFIGLAHVPALNPKEAAAELKRCAVELGFPGAVIASEMQDLPLDAEEVRPFWKACADLNLYVFIHPLPRVIRWARMDADDLGRMLGWEFSLMTAAVRLINSGLLDELPSLKIQFSHFAGGIGRYRGRIRGFQSREKWGTAQLPRHGRRPKQSFDHYLDQRLSYDIAGWAGPDRAAELGEHWVRFGLQELPLSQLVFASDYPQAVREPGEVAAYVAAVRELGESGRAIADGANAEKLIPDLKRRLAARASSAKVPA
ncbi:MAG: amidohydrolase family protein, partial [Xanthobacteraceae bacterium]